MSDADKLRTLATWFDHFDDWREATRKIAPGIAEYREVQTDLRRIAATLDAARTPALPRHLFSGEPGGPCTDICLLADDDPIHRALTNPVAPLDGLDEEDHRAEVEFERLGDAMDRAGYER